MMGACSAAQVVKKELVCISGGFGSLASLVEDLGFVAFGRDSLGFNVFLTRFWETGFRSWKNPSRLVLPFILGRVVFVVSPNGGGGGGGAVSYLKLSRSFVNSTSSRTSISDV